MGETYCFLSTKNIDRHYRNKPIFNSGQTTINKYGLHTFSLPKSLDECGKIFAINYEIFTTKFEEDLFNQINNHFVQKDFENQINLFFITFSVILFYFVIFYVIQKKILLFAQKLKP
mgnify:CR=1 FL=1